MYGVATDTGPTAGSLIRRQSLPRPAAACDASHTGDGDADGLPHGLPIHFSYGGLDRGSAKGGARKKERVYRYCSFTLLLALLVCTSAVYLLLKAHQRQGQQLAHHHAGWTATYEELQAKHTELRDHREALTRKDAELQSKHAQLAGASEQLTLFHNALQHKEATLAQLLEERQALQESVRSLMAASHAQAEAARRGGGGAAELAAVQGEVDSLRASLNRCFADLTAAVSSLRAEQEQGGGAQAEGQGHHGGLWAGDQVPSDVWGAAWDDGAWRAHHESVHQADRAA